MKQILTIASLLCSGMAAAVIPAPQRITETHSNALPPQVEGGYILRLSTSPEGEPVWHISASDEAGRFYAEQTKQQLIREYKGKLPKTLEVMDYPKLQWRGLHLDVSRHFFTVKQVKRLLDRMASLKLNRLHMHLTDSPGWRLEIKSYPKLTETGAWRRDTTNPDWQWKDTRVGTEYPKLYGGYYTQQDMRDLIAYAKSRHIMIVPEFDVPGHSFAAIMSYRDTLASPQFDPYGKAVLGHDVINIKNPETTKLVHAVFDEIMEIFPKETPIHVGGDEVTEEEISKKDQREWMQALVDHLRAKGREVIAWDETAMNGVKNQTVMVWHANQMKSLDRYKQPLILTPTSHCYFDFRQKNDGTEPLAMGKKVTTTRDVFEFTLPTNANIIGLQGNLWTEYIRGFDHLLYMAFPRGAALAERAWGSPKRSYEAFAADLKQHPQFSAPEFTREQQYEFFRKDKTLTPKQMKEYVKRQNARQK